MCVGPNDFGRKNLGFVIINGPHCVSSVVLTSIFTLLEKYVIQRIDTSVKHYQCYTPYLLTRLKKKTTNFGTWWYWQLA